MQSKCDRAIEMVDQEEDLQKVAMEQLHEDPIQRPENIQRVRLWLQENNHTKRTDDAFILMFLRSCKFNHKKTCKKIESYYAVRETVPEWFSWKDPSSANMEALLKLGIYIPIMHNNVTGSKIAITRLGVTDPGTMLFEDILSLERMLGEISFLEERVQILGVEVVVDMTGFGIKHLKYYTPNIIRFYVKLVNAFPVRLKGIHLLHMPLIFSGLLAMAKLLMSSKLRKRIHIHGNDLATLYEFIPKSCLPDEYGGTAGNLDKYIEMTQESVNRNRDFLMAISENVAKND